MSTLNVSALKNIGAGFTNLLLNSDGSVTLPVYTDASTPPVQFQAGTLWFNGTNLQIRNSANTAWVAVGGGSGTVTAVTATLPLASTGGTAPVLSLNLGLGTAVNGSNIAVSIPVASVPPAAGTGAAQALNGSMYWDDTLGQLFIRYINGGTPVWVAAAPPAGGSVSAATLAEAAAGTVSTKYSSPQTSVPKDASGMTGAAIIPSGTSAQQPATPVVGMQRFNTDSGSEEVYTGATLGWRNLQFVPSQTPAPADLTLTSTTYNNGIYVCKNLTIPAGVTASTTSYQAVFICYGNVVIDGTFTANACGGFGSAGGESSGGVIEASTPFGPGSFGGSIRTTPAVYTSTIYSPTVASYGSGGWGGIARQSVTPGATISPTGGNGGGGIIIRAYGTITMGASGVLSANGGNSTGGGIVTGGQGNWSGGGGGSGGCIILHADGNMTLAGALNARGGNGSGGGDNTGGSQGGMGGCGGGGGYIILQTASVLADTSTKNLSGGAAGATFGSSAGAVASYPGPSFGGQGGSRATYATPGAGSTGVVAYSGSPF